MNLLMSQELIELWKGDTPPFFEKNDLVEYEKEAYSTICVFDVIKPTLTIYPAKGKNTGNAVLIIPGGGYGLVAMYHEGYDIAEILSKNGITAGVLKYRLPNPISSSKPEEVPLSDARRAMEIMHERSDKYGFNQGKIGVMGFSAGSHLATVLSLWENEKVSHKPDFSCLVYGVTILNDENKKWLENDLYYRNLSKAEIEKNTLLNHVNAQSPPAFLVHAYDDDICPVEESTRYAEKMKAYNVPVEMHLFERGGHGFGAGRKEDGTDQWLGLFIAWLNNSFD